MATNVRLLDTREFRVEEMACIYSVPLRGGVDGDQAKLRFADVAHAIKTTPKSLRKWLQSGKITLDSNADPGWRVFSLRDLAILAIMRKLVDFGVSVEDAAKIVVGLVPSAPGATCFKYPTLVLTRSGNGWRHTLHTGAQARDADAKLILDLHAIVRGAFDRAVKLAGNRG